MFRMKAVEKIETPILSSTVFFFLHKLLPFMAYCGKIVYSAAGQAIDGNILRRMRFVRQITKSIIHTHTQPIFITEI